MQPDMILHNLKTHPEPFEDILPGHKSFEIRKNDRDFQIDDILILNEWGPESEKYSGQLLSLKVTYIFTGEMYGLKAGHGDHPGIYRSL